MRHNFFLENGFWNRVS
jgi:type I restriction enzyme R subunit